MRKHRLLAATLAFGLSIFAASQISFDGFVAKSQGGILAAPTNVLASDNAYANKVGISWDPIRGATTYRVFRNPINNPANALDIGTTQESVFFDSNVPAGQTFFYWVSAENGAAISTFSSPDQGSRAATLGQVGPVPPLNPPPNPPGNPVTAAKAALGKVLFWDEQLSSTRTVACGTCHFSTSGGSDPRSPSNVIRSTNPGPDNIFGTTDDVVGSPGVPVNNADGTYTWSSTFGFREQVTGRKSRSYLDAAYSNVLFWDGRATPAFTDPVTGSVVLQNGAALESQVLGPPVNAAEMAHAFRDWNDVASRVLTSRPLALAASIPNGLRNWIENRSYPELFAEAFGSSDVTPTRIAMAIATFERTVYPDRTPFDLSAAQITPLGPAEVRGQNIFNGPGRCNTCHAGPLFTDNQFHNIGLRPQTEDPGRFTVTGNPNQLGEFRTAGLRNVGLRAPYFHNGRFNSLEEVVEFYNRGGDFDAPNIDRNRIRQLGLSAQQKSDLVAFLRGALTDTRIATGTTPFDRPTLYSESSRVPQILGTGTNGSGGITPQVTAIEPPLVGNPIFTVAISNALGGTRAVLVIDQNDPGIGPTIPQTGSFTRLETLLPGSGPGQGNGSISLPIPNTPSLVGRTLFGRWFVPDPGAVGGVAVTPAFRITIFGEPSTVGPNPIDGNHFFVAQQYRDFLWREAEAGEPWTNVLNNCSDVNNDQACDRVTVSAAFFGSPEFQLKGYFVFRFYKLAFDRLPTYAEITSDMQSINAATPVEVFQRKSAFATNFIQRSEFTGLYGLRTNVEFVTTLLNRYSINFIQTPDPAQPDGNTKINLSKDDLIARLDAGTLSRTQVLRAIADSDEIAAAEFNKAFVAMQYYGYLRRAPEEGGYNAWLNYLNSHPTDSRTMVNGFVNSVEYRLRFGPR